jgi:hypothetical protein
MKLQRNALVLLISAAVLAGGVYFYETRKPNPEQNNAAGSGSSSREKIFNFQEGEISFLSIQVGEQTVAIERSTGKWMLSAPVKVPANDPVVAFLTNLLVTGERDRVLTVGADRKSEFGLDRPTGSIEITLNNQQKHRLVLGKLSFDRSTLYAQIDPQQDSSELKVSLISPQFDNAIRRKLDEWQLKPTPKASPTQSPAAQPTPTEPIPTDSPTAQPTPTQSPTTSPTPTNSPTAQPTPIQPTPTNSPSPASSSPTPETPKSP